MVRSAWVQWKSVGDRRGVRLAPIRILSGRPGPIRTVDAPTTTDPGNAVHAVHAVRKGVPPANDARPTTTLGVPSSRVAHPSPFCTRSRLRVSGVSGCEPENQTETRAHSRPGCINLGRKSLTRHLALKSLVSGGQVGRRPPPPPDAHTPTKF